MNSSLKPYHDIFLHDKMHIIDIFLHECHLQKYKKCNSQQFFSPDNKVSVTKEMKN